MKFGVFTRKSDFSDRGIPVYWPRKIRPRNSASFETTTHANRQSATSVSSPASGDLGVLDPHHEVLPAVGGLLVEGEDLLKF